MPIEEFYSINDLYKRIDDDIKSNRPSDIRYPVRFIFLNSFDSVKRIIQYLEKDVKIIELETYLPRADGWLTPHEVVNIIKDISNNAIIVPLSEFLRFQNQDSFYTILKNLTEIETSKNIRIYVPLIGLWERFQKEFWRNFYRKKEWAPIWKLVDKIQKIVIYQVNFNVKEIPSDKYVVSNTEEWFTLWKKDNVQEIVSLSNPLSYFYKDFLPDQIFEMREISNHKEYLEDLFDVIVPIEFKNHELEFWNELIKEVNAYNESGITIKEIFLKHFNLRDIKNLRFEDYIKLYLNSKQNYERWLIRNFFLTLDSFQSKYLYIIFNRLDKLGENDLIKLLWLQIFQLSQDNINSSNFYERKKLLKLIHEELNFSTTSIENALTQQFEKLKEFPLKRQFDYLTSITFVEKKYIIELMRDVDISKYDGDIRKTYPELYYYLDWETVNPDNSVDNWILDYFKEYNISKVKHKKSEKIATLINKKNSDKNAFAGWYYSITKQEMEKNSYKLVWIDGLGAEWFPLLVHLIEMHGKEKGKFVKKKIITRSSLPTITECNKHECEKINNLDKYVHEQKPYEYPNSLIREIEIIKHIVKKILDMPYERVCIVSDHGFSFLCLKEFGNFKKLNFEKSNHEGRCMWIESENYQDDEYFIVWTIDSGDCYGRKALIALKHTSLNNTPSREVHGGATLEETLVPCIIIDTKKDDIEYIINPVDFEVSISNPIVEFRISPQPYYTPEVSYKEKLFKLLYDENMNTYKLDLTGLRVGDYTPTLKIGNKQYDLKIKIKGGFKERDLL